MTSRESRHKLRKQGKYNERMKSSGVSKCINDGDKYEWEDSLPDCFFECTLRPRRSDQWALFEDCVKNIKLPNVGAGTSAVNINTEYSLAS